jgi:hypothetical protein
MIRWRPPLAKSWSPDSSPFIALPPAEPSPERSVCTPGSPPNRLGLHKPVDATGFEHAFLELHLEVGPAIHGDETGIQAARYPNGGRSASRLDAGAESVRAVVRQPHRLIFGSKLCSVSTMSQNRSVLFRGRHFEDVIIILCSPQDGHVFLDKAKFPASFAADVVAEKTAFMADSQVLWGVTTLSGAISDPAWKAKPSWYLVVTEDKMIPPVAQRSMSKRAGSTVVEVNCSHPSMCRNQGRSPRSSNKPPRASKPPGRKPPIVG